MKSIKVEPCDISERCKHNAIIDQQYPVKLENIDNQQMGQTSCELTLIPNRKEVDQWNVRARRLWSQVFDHLSMSIDSTLKSIDLKTNIKSEITNTDTNTDISISKLKQQTQKRKPGRPRLKPKVVLDRLSQQELKQNPEKCHRKVFELPECLVDIDDLGVIEIPQNNFDFQARVEKAEKFLKDVQGGYLIHGRKLLMENNVDLTLPEYTMPASMVNIYILWFLFSKDAMDTKHGKVSYFPSTIYQTKFDFDNNINGTPVFILHRSHLRCALIRKTSMSRKLMTMKNINNSFTKYVTCPFDHKYDELLAKVSGFEICATSAQKDISGFVLLRSDWLMVMAHHFLKKNGTPKTLRELVNTFYHDKPHINDIFKRDDVVWQGDTRDISVYDMLKLDKPNAMFNPSMTRCRPLHGRVCVRGKGVWKLKPKHFDKCYDKHSFTYGVECDIDQLECLSHLPELFGYNRFEQNNYYTYESLIKYKPPENVKRKIFHLKGINNFNLNANVFEKNECIAKGIINDHDQKYTYKRTSNSTRRARSKVNRTNKKQRIDGLNIKHMVKRK